jgi:hypothetical protein
VGVGVVHRAKTAGNGGPGGGGGVKHSQITEVYHVISGNATLVTEARSRTLGNRRPTAG